MKGRRTRFALMGVLAIALSAAIGAAPGAAQAKKKKQAKAGGTVDITQPVNTPIPDATATTNGVVASTITVGGRKFKKTVVRDVNVTLQATGSADGAAGELTARLTAPNGATTWLFGNALAGTSFGPTTFDDESVNTLGGITPFDPTLLVSPYAGTVQPHCFSAQGGCALSAMDGGPVTGAWTLRVVDNSPPPPTLTSVLNSWRITVVAGRPFKVG
jgi:subtilisin-like proprotein convertase family protein